MNFKRSNFFPYKNSYDINKLNLLLKDQILFKKILINFEIKDISSLSNLRENSLLFLESDLKILEINERNIHVISNVKENKKYYNNISIIKNINLTYNIICNQLFYHEDQIGFLDDFNYSNGSFISKFSKYVNLLRLEKTVLYQGV